MSSNHTIRQMIIDENLPMLVKSLTGFNDDDENFKLCETYAFSRIASHRFLSVNSHEVRRKIDGIAERFMADNYTQYGEKLKELVQEFVTDPLCTNHYELDVQWSIIHFLLGVSHNPVAALSEDKNSIKIADFVNDDDIRYERRRSSAMHELVSSLIQHNIPTIHDQASASRITAGDSDLSDWSDEEDEGTTQGENPTGDANIDQNTNDSMKTDVRPLRLKLIPFGKVALKPPEKKSIFSEFDSSGVMAWRQKTVQNPWWHTTSQNEETNTVLSEWCLLREIIWTLYLEPFDNETDSESVKHFSKFFSLNLNSDEVIVNSNISLISTPIESLQPILSKFASTATKLYRFRKFFATVFNPPTINSFLETVHVAPHSIQCYANGLKDFLRVVSKAICDLEVQLIEQDPTETYTVIYLHNQMLPHFRTVNTLYDIHTKVYIDFKTNAGHVCVAYLFASLINEMDTSLVEKMNIAASLFLVSIRFYLSVFNNWWIEGRFKDWCGEFLIEKCSNQNSSSSSNIYQRRSISAGISRSLDTNCIKERINMCKTINLFCDESMEAGYILNILYNLDKLTEMKLKGQQLNGEPQDIEQVFMNRFWEEINKFRIVKPIEIKETGAKSTALSVEDEFSKDEEWSLLSNDLGEMDALLSMAFDQYATNLKCQSDNSDEMIDDEMTDCYKIYKRIYEITDFPLPLTIIIHERLREILRSRISIANKYVLRIFLDEYKVLEHLINLQRVFFFGAGDLMLTFYSKLFKSMNSGEDWNNSYLLTVQLDGVLTTRYPQMHSMFSVEITAADSHIKDTLSSITDIVINYLVRDSIRDVIHDRALTKYNEIFQFLLQVKWAIWTLETLQFPAAFKKRPPYQSLTLIDLIFKRLALVRNWLIYSVQCIHAHLMTFVIQSHYQQLLKRMEKAECLREIIELHDSYIDTIHKHCFRKTCDIALKTSVEQLLSLVVILRDEWNNLHKVNSHGDFVDGENEFDVSGTVQQVDVIEATYINCHCHIAEVLTREVYKKDQLTLASLSAAFNCSCPY